MCIYINIYILASMYNPLSKQCTRPTRRWAARYLYIHICKYVYIYICVYIFAYMYMYIYMYI